MWWLPLSFLFVEDAESSQEFVELLGEEGIIILPA